MARDSKYIKLINTTRWRALRRSALGAHPICQDCEAAGRLSVAVEVHHLTPVQSAHALDEMAQLCYDPKNLRCLCHSCHIERHKALGRGSKETRKRIVSGELWAFAKKYLGGGEN